RELLRLGPDAPSRIDDGRLLHSALTQTEDYSRVGDDVRLMLQSAGRRATAPDLTGEQREQLLREFQGLTRDLLLRAQRMAEDGRKSAWTERPTDRRQTIAGYRAWLREFPGAEDVGDLHANVAELLLDEKRTLEAARQFELAAGAYAGQDKAKEAEEVQYNAAFAYQAALEDPAGGARVDIVQARAGLRRAGGTWLATSPDGPKARAMAFSIARSYHDEGNYLTAVDLLTAVTVAYPRFEEGQAAALLVLDAHNALNQMTSLLRAGQRFAATDSGLPAKTKSRIRTILASAEQRQLDELALAASGDEAGGIQTLMDFVDTYEGSDLAERALLSTFVAAQAQGDANAMFEVGAAIMKKFPESSQTPGVASALGQVATARYELGKARAWLDLAGNKTQDNAQARAIFLSLAELELRLGDPTAAITACRAALTRARQPTERGEVFRMLARVVEESFDPRGVVSTLRPFENIDPEVDSLLGLALVKLGQIDDGEGVLASVTANPSAEGRAIARAKLGLAEANLSYLKGFRPSADIDAIDELIGLVELTVQGYLTAARQPEPDLSLVSLGRLAKAATIAADKLEASGVPTGLPPADRKLLQQALAQRVTSLRSAHTEALAECANRARAAWIVDRAGQACLTATLPDSLPVDPVQRTSRRAASPSAEAARSRLASDPSDVAALRELGGAYLSAGDGHAARLAFEAAVAESGESDDLMKLAAAHRALGDRVAEAAALGRALAAGHPEAEASLATLLVEIGLPEEAARLRGGEP
ncbi:MAG: hypothetical protein AAF602_06460, partial [Myxococcota bacterium]